MNRNENAKAGILTSGWSTRKLAGFACIWAPEMIGGTVDESFEYYATVTDDAELREYAAKALAMAGFTIARINARKS